MHIFSHKRLKIKTGSKSNWIIVTVITVFEVYATVHHHTIRAMLPQPSCHAPATTLNLGFARGASGGSRGRMGRSLWKVIPCRPLSTVRTASLGTYPSWPGPKYGSGGTNNPKGVYHEHILHVSFFVSWYRKTTHTQNNSHLTWYCTGWWWGNNDSNTRGFYENCAMLCFHCTGNIGMCWVFTTQKNKNWVTSSHL